MGRLERLSTEVLRVVVVINLIPLVLVLGVLTALTSLVCGCAAAVEWACRRAAGHSPGRDTPPV